MFEKPDNSDFDQEFAEWLSNAEMYYAISFLRQGYVFLQRQGVQTSVLFRAAAAIFKREAQRTPDESSDWEMIAELCSLAAKILDKHGIP